MHTTPAQTVASVRQPATRKRAIEIRVSRPQLTAEDEKTLATKMRQAYKWDADPKDFQLAAVRAQIEGVDMIVQAPTGSGKTALAAGPHLWPGNEKKVTFVVSPLLSLEEEQVFELEFMLQAVRIY